MKLVTLSAALLAFSAMTFAAAPADTAKTAAKATAPVAAAPAKTAAAPAKPAAPVKGSAYYQKVLKALEDPTPANARQAKLTHTATKARENRIVYLEKELPKSEEIASQAKACSLYVELIRVEARTQAVRNNVSANWQKRMQTQQQIETTQERIGEERSGKASTLAADLDAERTRLAQTNKAMTDQQNDAALREARLKAEADSAAARLPSFKKCLAKAHLLQ